MEFGDLAWAWVDAMQQGVCGNHSKSWPRISVTSHFAFVRDLRVHTRRWPNIFISFSLRCPGDCVEVTPSDSGISRSLSGVILRYCMQVSIHFDRSMDELLTMALGKE